MTLNPPLASILGRIGHRVARFPRPAGALVAPFLAALGLLSGCSITPVQPWEKGQLAKPGMRFASDRLENRYAEHIYSSKEGASGGAAVGGGGCGCN